MSLLKYLLLGLVLFISFSSNSQSEDLFSAYTIPVELKEKANAVVRSEKKTIEIISNKKLKVITHRTTTVFNKNGNRHVNAFEFYDDSRKIDKIEALVYDANGEEIKKIKERDFKDVSAVSDFSIYEDDRVKYLDYNPLEYPYTVEYYSEVTYNSTAFFPSWIPLDDYYVSIQNAEYKIVNEVGLDLKTKKENFEDYNITEVSTNHFKAENIEGIKYEAYTSEIQSIVPLFKATLKEFDMFGVAGINNNWSDFGKWMHDRLLVGTDEISEETKNKVKALTAGVDDKIERAKIIYNYMQNRTRYISVQVGIGGWKPMLADDVDRLGYADCKGLTNYTKALLDAADVSSYYTVVYGGRGIRNIDNDFSSVQGNHVILCLPNENENIFLECTSQTNPFGFIAGFTDDRDVLLVKPDGGEIVHTRVYAADDSVQETKASVFLNDSGGFEAEVQIKTTGYQYNLHQGIEVESERNKNMHYKDYWSNINNLNISTINIENDKENIVYTENVKLSSNNYISKSGSRLIFEPNMFNRVTDIPPRYKQRRLEFKIDRSFNC